MLMDVAPDLRGFKALCRALGEPLEPHMARIAKAVIEGPEREVGACLPRGNSKTTVAALLGVHHLVAVPGSSVTVGAASRDQARILFERARGFAEHPAIATHLVVRHLELRGPEGALLRVIPADAGHAHGLSSDLYLADEVWTWRDDGLLEALQTALAKRSDATLLAISTAPASAESTWGRMRARALAQRDCSSRGMFTEARGSLHWLEWSAPADADVNDYRLAARANPSKRFTAAVLREARARVPEATYRQFHLNQLGVTEASWLPPAAWATSVGQPQLEDGDRIWVGVFIGKSGSAVAWINEARHVGVWSSQLDDGGLEARETVLGLAEDFEVVEVALDPWRSAAIAHELGKELQVVEVPNTDSRMIPASSLLRDAITERRLVLPDDDDLRDAAGRAVSKESRRGWKVDGEGIGPLLALLLAVDAAGAEQPQAALLGWL
jgi:phage terminase large subunit-like protein